MDYGYIAYLLILIGIILIAVEIVTPGFFIAIPGTIAIIYGFVILLFPWILETWWGPWILLLLVFPIGYITYTIYRRLSPPASPVTESYEGLIGKTGIVVETVKPDSLEGKVKIGSDIWSATSDRVIPKGEKVIVVNVEGVHLIVKPIDKETKSFSKKQ
ncbi:NfeD family protein [Desulfurococcaceae archaeon MEX13E-LK6-19]|nr:NfeD family protein [Desulfurococcaceae archaeon MEX13E-LK6-19]